MKSNRPAGLPGGLRHQVGWHVMVEVYEDPGTGQQPQSGGSESWSFRNALAKGFAGTLGILAALAIDYLRKRDNSALIYASKLVNQAAMDMHFSAVPAYVYLAIVLIAGFAMVYIFEPTNKRNAFYAGAGVLGFLATFSPIAQQTLQIPSAGELPSLDALLQATQTVPGEPAAPAPTETAPAAPTPDNGGHAFNDTGAASPSVTFGPVGERSQVVLAAIHSVPVNIVISFPASSTGTASEIKVWVHVDATGQTQTLGSAPRFARMGDKVVGLYQTSVMTAASGSTLVEVRVEAEGCEIVEKPFSIAPDAKTARVDIALKQSNTPLVTQRLTHPYRW